MEVKKKRIREFSGNLFIIVAPSGAGKSTLINALLYDDPSIRLSISYTSRPKRLGELNGREYHFVNVLEFLQRRNAGEFIESAKVHGNYYGTSRLWINEQLSNSNDVLLEIDWQGARQIRKKFRNAIEIFILPPSITILEERLKKRGLDDPETIRFRKLGAIQEIAHAAEADYIIINEFFEHALRELRCIITASRLHFFSQKTRHPTLFAQLGI